MLVEPLDAPIKEKLVSLTFFYVSVVWADKTLFLGDCTFLPDGTWPPSFPLGTQKQPEPRLS